ncbi:hypothetical protein F7725_000371 [Dissostichus mawsoni]|uniref:Uncharacterized protein n=1 Tax=Dissostichus mawsoni TaxID=36200 RepID=A0A7J5ZEQ1_DISMA|nr:hypothetical protein F7725_000371 [Dissostichus mawsoni]
MCDVLHVLIPLLKCSCCLHATYITVFYSYLAEELDGRRDIRGRGEGKNRFLQIHTLAADFHYNKGTHVCIWIYFSNKLFNSAISCKCSAYVTAHRSFCHPPHHAEEGRQRGPPGSALESEAQTTDGYGSVHNGSYIPPRCLSAAAADDDDDPFICTVIQKVTSRFHSWELLQRWQNQNW